jgi:polysaccharide biosynthesis transport protein
VAGAYFRQTLLPMQSSELQSGSALNLADILATLWKRKVSFAITFAICLAISAGVTIALPKIYSADAVMLVSSGGTGTEISNAQESDLLTKTYAELVQTSAVADEVASKLPFKMGGGAVENAVTVSPVSGSQLLRVQAEDRDPDQAQTLANTFAEVAETRAANLAAEGGGPATVSIAERALVPTSPVRPKPALYLLIGAVLAMLLAAAAALLRDRLGDPLRVDASTTRVLGLPVIGRVPDMGFNQLAMLRSPVAWRASSEPWRFLLANLDFAAPGGGFGSLAIVSPGEQEGKSTCAVNLARAAGERGISTLLVDADMRLGTASSYFTDAADRGFSNLLAHPGRVKTVAVGIPGTAIHAIPSGPVPENPSALLSSENLAEFDNRAADNFDLIVYDTPPLRVGADASLIAAQADGVLLVIDALGTKRPAAMRAVDQLNRAGANVLGVVLNRFSDSEARRYANYGRPSARGDSEPAPPPPRKRARAAGSRQASKGT